MTTFSVSSLSIEGPKLIKRKSQHDKRGYFDKIFSQQSLSFNGIRFEVCQVNHSFNAKVGTLRGLHFQVPPFSDAKLITCVSGSVFDVIVDLRHKSPSFGECLTFNLNADDPQSLYIPKGFAHGFQTLQHDTLMLYLHDQEYEQTANGGINALDPELRIRWPKFIANMSSRDISLPKLASFPEKTFTNEL